MAFTDYMQDLSVCPSINQDSHLIAEWLSHVYRRKTSQAVVWTGMMFESRPNVGLLEQALRVVVGRHDALRMGFPQVSTMTGAAAPRLFSRLKERSAESALFNASIQSDETVNLHVVDCGDIEVDETLKVVKSGAVRDQVNEPFDYRNPPLLRAGLFVSRTGRSLLSVVVHHLVCDGWSIRLIRRELAMVYSALMAQRPVVAGLRLVPPQYSEFAVWQRRELARGGEESLRYWCRHWSDYLSYVVSLEECTGVPGCTQTVTCGRGFEALTVGASLVDMVATFCKRARVTLYVCWLTALLITVRARAGRDRVALFSYLANRPREWVESVGWFSNAYLLGITFDKVTDGYAALEEVRRVVASAMANETVPMGLVLGTRRKEGHGGEAARLADWVSFDCVGELAFGLDDPWTDEVWHDVAGRQIGQRLEIRVMKRRRDIIITSRFPLRRGAQTAVYGLLQDIEKVMGRIIRHPGWPIDNYVSARES